MLIDTHTHLYLEEFEPDGKAAAVDRALAAGVGHMVLPNVDLTTIEPLLELHRQRPEVTSAAMGLHPTEVKEDWREQIELIERAIVDHAQRFVAIGEIGMDLYWDSSFKKEQMEAMDYQVRLAEREGLGVIIHCREALDETLEVLQGHRNIKGVMHSFGGSEGDVERILATTPEMMFGINGIVTFKNSHVRDTLPAIGLERLLLETDSPYLAPVPFRGKRCESSMLVHTARHIAGHLGIEMEKLAEATTANAGRLFGLDFAGKQRPLQP